MTGARGRVPACDNMNHRRRDAPVAHCPQCGGVVNAGLTSVSCNETAHAAARRRQSTFCVDCGTRLVMLTNGHRPIVGR